MRRSDRTDFWTPRLAMWAFWIGAIPLLIAFAGAVAFKSWLMALWFIVLVFVLRMWVELVVVAFKIYDVLIEIRDQGNRPPPAPARSVELERKLARAREREAQRKSGLEPGEMRLG